MPSKLLEHDGAKFTARIGASDEKTFQEVVVKRAYEKKEFKVEAGERWIDLGGNVGAFAVFAGRKGAEVICYEPDPANIKQIRENLALNGLAAQIHARAVVHDDRPAVTFNLWPGGQSWRNSMVRNKKGTQPLTVLCANFFKFVQPSDCVKMDIEGAEIAILEAWPEGFRTRKLVFEYSFDVDPSVARLRAILAKLKRAYPNVKHTSQVDKIERWDFFPPATMVHCW